MKQYCSSQHLLRLSYKFVVTPPKCLLLPTPPTPQLSQALHLTLADCKHKIFEFWEMSCTIKYHVTIQYLPTELRRWPSTMYYALPETYDPLVEMVGQHHVSPTCMIWPPVGVVGEHWLSSHPTLLDDDSLGTGIGRLGITGFLNTQI